LALAVLHGSAKLLTASQSAQTEPQVSALHDVVGQDGVLMIHLERGGRTMKASQRLSEVGVTATKFPAVDVDLASNESLRQGCLLRHEPGTSFTCKGELDAPGGRPGEGCFFTIEQAIAESHRQALLKAQNRNATWTAIMEDDAVPIDQTSFNANFKKIWAQVPPQVGFVRLGWCIFDPRYDHELITNYTYKNLRLVSGYRTGACLTGYMVRRDFIPTVLRLFPCCTALDTCFEFDLFKWPPRCGQEGAAPCWGQKHMMGIDLVDSAAQTAGWATFGQRGIVAQDNRKEGSGKHKWKQTHEGVEK